MPSYWLEWNERGPASVDASDEQAAIELGEQLTGFKPIKARTLYYRALPVLDAPATWPPYCIQPELCAGHTYCTRASRCDS